VAPTVPGVVSGAPGAVSPPASSLPIQVCVLKMHSFMLGERLAKLVSGMVVLGRGLVARGLMYSELRC
jgi:hypothetical protein